MRDYIIMLFIGLYRLREHKKYNIDKSVIKAYRQAIKCEIARPWLKKYVISDVDSFTEIYLVDSKDLEEANQFVAKNLTSCIGEPVITKVYDDRFKIKYTFYHEW